MQHRLLTPSALLALAAALVLSSPVAQGDNKRLNDGVVANVDTDWLPWILRGVYPTACHAASIVMGHGIFENATRVCHDTQTTPLVVTRYDTNHLHHGHAGPGVALIAADHYRSRSNRLVAIESQAVPEQMARRP
jgi:hypothetical protein